MAEFGPELEDGESYIPSGILLGEDGWAAAGRGSGGQHHRQLLQRQSFFSDGVGGLPCYPPELARRARDLPPCAMVTKAEPRLGAQNPKPRGNISASRLHFQEGFQMGCLYSAVASEVVSGYRSGGNGSSSAMGQVVFSPEGGMYTVGPRFACPLHPVKLQSGRVQVHRACAGMVQRQAEARFPSARAGGKGQKCAGTGVFLPVARLQCESWKMPKGKSDGAPKKQENNSVGMVVKQARTEMGLPQDWTY